MPPQQGEHNCGNATIVTVLPSTAEDDGGTYKKFDNITYSYPIILPIECSCNRRSSVEKANLETSTPDSDSESEYDSGDETESEADSQTDIVKRKETSDNSNNPTASCETLSKKKRSLWSKYGGMVLAIISSFIFALSALLVKKLESYDPFNSALYKFQGAFIPAIPLILQKYYCSKKGPAIIERVWPLTEKKKIQNLGLVLLRSFLSCNALMLHFFSLKYLPMADALTISAASPIFVTILAKIFLGEKCGYSTVIASVCSLVGVVAIAKPPILSGSESFNTDILIGSGIAFACTIVTSVSFIVLRYIRKVHYSVTTLSYGAWGSFENLLIILVVPGLGLRVPTMLSEWGLVAGMALLTLLGQFAIILAMKREAAGPVALIRTFDVLFAFLFEIIVLHSLPDVWSIVGATIIVLSVAFVGLRKWVRSFPKGHPMRSRLRFISM